MYKKFFTYAIFIVVIFVSMNYLTCNCLSPGLGAIVTFASYLVIAYIIANSMRYTLEETDGAEKSVRLSFDILLAVVIIISAYCRYGGNFWGKK